MTRSRLHHSHPYPDVRPLTPRQYEGADVCAGTARGLTRHPEHGFAQEARKWTCQSAEIQ
jgi:hypothetical protein